MSKVLTGAVATGIGCVLCAWGLGSIKPPAKSAQEPPRSPNQRPQLRPTPSPTRPPDVTSEPASYPHEFRRIDGWWNNADHGDWGAAGHILLRDMPNEYGDGIGNIPAGQDRPSTREISNVVMAQNGMMPNETGVSDFLWQWGQFIDHDIVETPVASPAEHFDIPVPSGDKWFDPNHEGDKTIPLDRSGYLMVNGVREQVNHITSYLDGSNVYGSDRARAMELRTLDGTGRLKQSGDGLLPYNVHGFPNAPNSDPSFFLAGDIRCNEQNGLTAMHTLFVREHNYWANRVHQQAPNLDGDSIYAYARAIVGAEIQAITYREFLPALLGPDAIPDYEGYKPDVDASISNIFATSAYRMGHSMLSPTLLRLDADGNVIPAGNLPLAQAFFRPTEIVAHGIEPLLRGLATQRSQELDPYVIDSVRNMLFGPPGSGGLDLAALNLQRGRDHGLPSYNSVRTELGLAQVHNFSEITPDPVMAQHLEQAYGTVDKVDAWAGLLAEPHLPDAMVGQCLSMTIADQFTRLRDGDRFWYQTYLGPQAQHYIERQTLATIIRRNTTIGNEIQDDVFHVPQ